MAKQIEAYSPEYEDEQFNELAPKVEAAVRQMFPHTRGARFGAMQAILARRLANLRTEIMMNSAREKAKVTEQKRRDDFTLQRDRETRAANQSETMRVENVKRMDEWTKQTRDDQQKRADAAVKAQEAKYKHQGGYEVEGEDPKIGDRKKKRKFMEYGDAPDVESFMDNKSLTARTFATPHTYNPRSQNPSTPPPISTGGRDYSQNSGDIPTNSVDYKNQWDKFTDDVTDTAKQTWEGIKSGWDSLFGAPRIGNQSADGWNKVGDSPDNPNPPEDKPPLPGEPPTPPPSQPPIPGEPPMEKPPIMPPEIPAQERAFAPEPARPTWNVPERPGQYRIFGGSNRGFQSYADRLRRS